MIILLCWIVLAAADAVASGVISMASGIAFKKIFLWGLLTLILPPLAVAYGSLWERNRFKVKEVEIAFENLPESFDGYRIVHISDIHARSFIGLGETIFPARICARPEITLITLKAH